MRLRCTVAGVDISSAAYLHGVKVSKGLSGEIGTAEILLKVSGPIWGAFDWGAAEWTFPTFDQIDNAAVLIENADTDAVIFRGFVAKVSRNILNSSLTEWRLACQDETTILDRVQFSKTYEGESDKNILLDIFTSFLPDLNADTANVDQLKVSIQRLDFQNKTAREAITQIAKLTGGEWRLDDGEFYYALTQLTAAPYGLSTAADGVTTKQIDDIKLDDDVFAMANDVTVLGAFDTLTDERITANAQDATSIAAYGTQKLQIFEPDIEDVIDAQALADAELLRRKNPKRTGSITTREDGFDAGQLVEVTSAGLELDAEELLIRKITIEQRTGSQTRYKLDFGGRNPNLTDRINEVVDRVARNRTKPENQSIPAGSIDATKIADEAITAAKLADQAVTTAKIALLAIQESLIAAGAITTTKIADDAISTPKLAAGSVVTAKLAAGAITANEIATDAVTAAKILAGSISTAKLAAGAVTANELAAAAVTAGKIAANAISASNIIAGTITANEIANSTITNAKIVDGTIQGAKIQNGTIIGTKIQGGTITGANIADATITNAKIADLAADKITAGTISASISITSPDIVSTSGSNVAKLTGGVIRSEVSSTSYVQMVGSVFTSNTSSGRIQIIGPNLTVLSSSGFALADVGIQSGHGILRIRDSGGTVKCFIEGSGGDVVSQGNVSCVNLNATGVIQVDGSSVINSAGAFVGAGVDVGANGISCGNYNLNGGHIGVGGPTTFTTVDGKTVTVRGGIITSIV